MFLPLWTSISFEAIIDLGHVHYDTGAIEVIT